MEARSSILKQRSKFLALVIALLLLADRSLSSLSHCCVPRLSLLVVFVIWKALTTYNRRVWPTITIYAVVLGSLWIASFVAAKFISKQTRMANIQIWTSVVALVVVGLFGSVQGLVSYWAYTMMKRALNEGNRRVTFKFMLAIVVTLFFGVARAVWNIANLFGVNVLDDMFSLLLVEGKQSAYGIYFSYFMLVEVVPSAIAILILASEDIDSGSGENAYNILTYDPYGRTATTGPRVSNGSFTTPKRVGGGGAFNAVSHFDDSEDGVVSPDDFDHTLNDEDLVRDSEAPFKNIDFHPGQVIGRKTGTPPVATSPYRPINNGRPSQERDKTPDYHQLGVQTPNTDPSRLAGGDYNSVTAIQAPHVGVISTASGTASSPPLTSLGPTVTVGSYNSEPRGAEGTFKDFHQIARPTSPTIIHSPALSSSPTPFHENMFGGKHHYYQDPSNSETISAVSTSSTPTTTFITTINPNTFNAPSLSLPRNESVSLSTSPASSIPSPEGSYSQVPMSRMNEYR